MLKVPEETWKRLFEFKEGFNGSPWISSLHEALGILIDVAESAKEQGFKIELFRERKGYYHSRNDPVRGKLVILEIQGPDVPDQDLMDLMKDGEQIQDDTETDS